MKQGTRKLASKTLVGGGLWIIVGAIVGILLWVKFSPDGTIDAFEKALGYSGIAFAVGVLVCLAGMFLRRNDPPDPRDKAGLDHWG
ncbi:MAG: hypothetical protein JWL69_4365 [Phycisphaerales bacterium]|nr:hypothetical protein [Phycisphaerales bacterium]